ncbi:hypothetical protein PV325_008824 [Microctonus aethiopoides]|nr:hypothetical protein PV325_008824 [Microctonus aethiopoides]
MSSVQKQSIPQVSFNLTTDSDRVQASVVGAGPKDSGGEPNAVEMDVVVSHEKSGGFVLPTPKPFVLGLGLVPPTHPQRSGSEGDLPSITLRLETPKYMRLGFLIKKLTEFVEPKNNEGLVPSRQSPEECQTSAEEANHRKSDTPKNQPERGRNKEEPNGEAGDTSASNPQPGARATEESGRSTSGCSPDRRTLAAGRSEKKEGEKEKGTVQTSTEATSAELASGSQGAGRDDLRRHYRKGVRDRNQGPGRMGEQGGSGQNPERPHPGPKGNYYRCGEIHKEKLGLDADCGGLPTGSSREESGGAWQDQSRLGHSPHPRESVTKQMLQVLAFWP